MNQSYEEVGKLTKAAVELMNIGFTPSQVAYVFRDAVSSFVATGETVRFERLEDAITQTTAWVGNGFSMADDEGYCYLRLVKAAKRADVAQELLKNPTVGRFLTLEKADLDTVALRKYTFEKTKQGSYHVRVVVAGETTAADYVASTVLSLSSDATPMYHAYRRHAKCVKPLDVHAKVGGGASEEIVGEEEYLMDMATREGKTVAIINPNVIEIYSRSVDGLVVVCPRLLKPYLATMYKSVDILTPDELRVSNENWDAVVLTSGVASDLISAKARLKMSMRFARKLVCYATFESVRSSEEMLSFISSLPLVATRKVDMCSVTFRRPEFDIVEHTVCGGYLFGNYGSMERAAECSSGAIGKCVLATVFPSGTGVTEIYIGGDTTFHSIGAVSYIDGKKTQTDDSVILGVGDIRGYTSSAQKVLMQSFRDTLFIDVTRGRCVDFQRTMSPILTRLNGYSDVVSVGYQLGLVFEPLRSVGLLTTVGSFVDCARKTLFDLHVPSAGCNDVGYILKTSTYHGIGGAAKQITETSSEGVLHAVDFQNSGVMVFSGEHRFVAVVPSAPVMMYDNGNWFYANLKCPFVVQRGCVLFMKSLHRQCAVYVVGLTSNSWIKSSDSRLLGEQAGCWAAGGLSHAGGLEVGEPISMGDGCISYYIDVPPGATKLAPDIYRACVVYRLRGSGCIGVCGAFMSAVSRKICIKGGFDVLENYGDDVVSIKIVIIHSEYEFDNGGPSDDEFSDAVDESHS